MAGTPPNKANSQLTSGRTSPSRPARARTAVVTPNVSPPSSPFHSQVTPFLFYLTVTGCINSSHLSRLNPNDAGGQYDSSGGYNGQGNPQGSQCLGYKHYVELVEPRGPRACIKCCDDPADCPTNKDTQGCPNVIPGNYFDCN